MEQIDYKFVDRTGASESTSEILDPVLIKKEAIQTEIERLAGLPAADNGRRVSRIVNPAAGVGDCLAAGTAVSLCVLKPGEHTQRIRHNSSLVNFCIRGAGYARVDGRKMDFSQYDLFNIPAWSIYEYGNDTDELQVRLVYSSSALLEKLQVHIVEENPTLEPAAHEEESEPQDHSNRMNPFGTFQLTEDGAYLMPYEQLISPEVVRNKPLLWPWNKVKTELDKLKALGQSYVGRRLYLLYNPATGRANGTTHNYFAAITVRPKNIEDKPHRHISSAINYFFGGHGYSVVKGTRYEWEAGDLMLTAPGWAVHVHNSGDQDVYELTIQDSPLHISMETLLWQEDLNGSIETLGATGGFHTDRELKMG